MPIQCYGIPYMGSKWRLADWILSYLPDAPIDAPHGGEREREYSSICSQAGAR